jgi:hypothetical protein
MDISLLHKLGLCIAISDVIIMKGIAIAMETIVYIILAVLVLGILIYFLTSQAGPVIRDSELQQKRAEYCSEYISHDPNCDNPNSESVKNVITVDGKGNLVNLLTTQVCPKIPGAGCSLTDAKTCIQNCCFVCRRSP